MAPLRFVSRLALVLIVSSVVVLGARRVQPARATAGDLDPSFGSGGVVTTDLGNSVFVGTVLLQADGKIIAAAYAQPAVVLVRYNADGTLDPTFGIHGIAQTVLNEDLRGEKPGLALQPDGKLLVAASTFGDYGSQHMIVLRYNQDGTVDTSFGTNGTVVDLILVNSYAASIIVDGLGRIVVSAIYYYQFGSSFTSFHFMHRYLSDGTLDVSFGINGTVRDGDDQHLGAQILLVQADGKYIAAGGEMARYNADGTPDTTFGNGGLVNAPLLTSAFAISDAALQVDGKIVVVGRASTGGSIIARYNANGTLDQGFGTAGSMLTNFCTPPTSSFYCDDEYFGLALQGDGKLVATGVGGTASGGTYTYLPLVSLARYTASGQLDPTFGQAQTGKVTTAPSPPTTPRGVAIQADGRIVVASGASGGTGNLGNLVLFRYLAGSQVITKLAFTQQPTSAVVNQPFSVTVAVEGADSKPVQSDNSTSITLSATGGASQLNCTKNPQPVQAGVATFSCSLSQPGSYKLHAEAGALAADSAALGVTDCTANDDHDSNGELWNLAQIHIREAWTQFPNCRPNSPVTIAVVDSGVDSGTNNGQRDLIGDVGIIRNYTGNATANDDVGHGTLVTGIIAATADNNIGISGIARGSTVNVYKAYRSGGKFRNTSQPILYAKAIIDAVNDKAKVINISWGGPTDGIAIGNLFIPCTLLTLRSQSPTCKGGILEQAIQYAQDRNVVIVAADGEDGTLAPVYPAAFSLTHENVIAVAASNSSGSVAVVSGKGAYSTPGKYVTVSAPGGEPGRDEIKSLWAKDSGKPAILCQSGGSANKLCVTDVGTSFAAPHVTGVVALILAANQNLCSYQVTSIVKTAVTKWSGAVPENYWGNGIINAQLAVQRAIQTVGLCTKA